MGEWEKERARAAKQGGREKMLSIFKGREVNQKETDKVRQPHKLVNPDTLCTRTKKDCSATHFCISFIYLLKMDTGRFK